MATSFSDGTTIAALRWAGPAVSMRTHDGMLARRGDDVVFARRGELMRLGHPFGAWPPEVGSPHGFFPRDLQHQVATTTLALLENGNVLCATHAHGIPNGTIQWRPGDGSEPLRVDAACFEVTPDGGLYTVSPAPSGFVIEHRATGSLDEAPRRLGQLKYTAKSRCHACTTALADGSLLVLLSTADGLGGPVALYRVRAGAVGDDVLEAVQSVRHVSIVRSADAPRKRAKVAPRSDVVAVGGVNLLVPSPRGAWLVTGADFPTQPGVHPPIHVFELVGEGLALARPPFSVPLARFDRLRAACAVGELLAIATNGAAAGISLTDGVVSLRVEGAMGRLSSSQCMDSIVASPRGDALLVAFGTGLARCELLRAGDARLAEPAYDEPPPPPAAPQPPAPPRPPPLRRDTWLLRLRLHHIVATISARNLDDDFRSVFEGDATSGRAYAHDGSGNHIAAVWSEAGVVVLGYDHDYGPFPRREFLGELPDDLAALGEKVLRWMKPLPATDVAWFSVAEDRGGKKTFSQQLDKFVADEATMLTAWSEYYAISAAQLDLARALAAAPPGRVLTDAEVAVLREKPGPVADWTAAKQPIDPSFAVELDAVARRLLRDAGIEWNL